MTVRVRFTLRGVGVWGGVLVMMVASFAAATARAQATVEPPDDASVDLVRTRDRIAWIGSSSTKIGVWPSTVEFLLRTRHPELSLEFQRFSTGGGTFKTGLEHLDAWLAEFHPTLVVFNYGGNDANAGLAGLPRFQETMRDCVGKAHAHQARVILMTPQAADIRKSGAEPASNRTLYAETMLNFGRRQGWNVIDVHHGLDVFQTVNQDRDPAFSMLRDKIHLTAPGYIGWGYLAYDRLNLPFARSALCISAKGDVKSAENCEARDITSLADGLAFNRLDRVLPILPPGPLPPRRPAPIEAHSRYLLQVTDLETGEYEIFCERQLIGACTAAKLGVGVNLNSLLLDADREAPWAELARHFWRGEKLQQIGHTSFHFEIHRR